MLKYSQSFLRAVEKFFNSQILSLVQGLRFLELRKVRHRNSLSSYDNSGITTGLKQGHKVCYRNHKAFDCLRSRRHYKTHLTIYGGRYWDRTSDPFHVKEVRYRCANRPYEVLQLIEVETGFEPV